MIVDEFELMQNYPNPFNYETLISYTLPRQTDVVLKIFNVLGKEIRTLVQEKQDAGTKTVVWNGKDNSGKLVSTGIYIYSLKAGNDIQRKSMILLK